MLSVCNLLKLPIKACNTQKTFDSTCYINHCWPGAIFLNYGVVFTFLLSLCKRLISPSDIWHSQEKRVVLFSFATPL